ncbi:hypothetical protein I3500192B8_13780 [Acidaminococcus intestini]
MEEKLAFLKALNLQDIEFFGLHMSNVLPINRQYPRDEKVLVRELDGHYAAFPETLKQAHPERGREGRVLLYPLISRLQKITVTKVSPYITVMDF